MGSINVRKETGKLVLDFRYKGVRCREHTALEDSGLNRKKVAKILERIEVEIKLGTFDYAKFFPGSKLASRFQEPIQPHTPAAIVAATGALTASQPGTATPTPTFAEFAVTWVAENEIGWRKSHRRTLHDILNGHLLPAFGEKAVDRITKSDLLVFRSTLGKAPGRKAETLSSKRINAIMAPLRQILNEAADRFDFTTPYRNIKPLKLQKSDVEPFSLEEVRRILATVRPDYRDYLTVRFFTGMRTGEIDGLKWQYVDFDRRLILVRETIVAGEQDYTKTDGSQREIQMSEVVFQALKAQARVSRGRSPFVFCTREGTPFEHNNITKRVWYPLLRYLGLKPRRPYQTRHTAATLWLACGENPQWIARQLGHSSTEMLFKVYARFVPNLTRQDGSAFERLLLQSGTVTGQGASPATHAITPDREEAHHG